MKKLKFFTVIFTFVIAVSFPACTAKKYKSANLKDLPAKYTIEMAKSNGDVVYSNTNDKYINGGRLKQFDKNANSNRSDNVRITAYTDEGDPIITDLTCQKGSITLTQDNTRDTYSDQKITTYRVTKLIEEKKPKGTTYKTQLKNGSIVTLATIY